MSASSIRIAHNLESIRRRIAEAAARAGREPDGVRLVAVTKSVGIPEIRALLAMDVRHIGENRVHAAAPKIEAIGSGAHWHMIGYMQRRKCREVAALFDSVDSVDRVELAETLQRRCEAADRTLEALVELNVSGEENKHGFPPHALEAALRAMRAYDRLQVRGLMTMAPYGAPEAVLRAVFRQLRELADAHGLPERSMGMSGDFELAIEEGATQVRIGGALFA